MSVSDIRKHFEEYGTVDDVVAQPEARKCVVVFARAADAQVALSACASRPVCNNRFIRASWGAVPNHASTAPAPPAADSEPAAGNAGNAGSKAMASPPDSDLYGDLRGASFALLPAPEPAAEDESGDKESNGDVEDNVAAAAVVVAKSAAGADGEGASSGTSSASASHPAHADAKRQVAEPQKSPRSDQQPSAASPAKAKRREVMNRQQALLKQRIKLKLKLLSQNKAKLTAMIEAGQSGAAVDAGERKALFKSIQTISTSIKDDQQAAAMLLADAARGAAKTEAIGDA